EFYRKIYPIAALVILAFEAWALYIQLQAWGMKTTEYSFILLWILTAVAAVLLIIAKNKAYIAILSLTCVMALIWALPVIGAHALPVSIQSDRLENLLTEQEILKTGEIVPAASVPDREVREAITDSVMFLAYSESSKLPAWFDKNLAQSDVFTTKLGFDQTWPEPVDIGSPNEFISLSLTLPPEAVDISDYRWAVTLRDSYQKQNGQIILNGENGVYRIYWIDNSTQGIPTLKIMLDDRILIERDLNDFIDQTTEKYPPGKEANYKPTFEDMSIKIETPELSALLVLRDVNINIDPQNDTINYWISPDALYINER
ncbi:MAG: DUF4153 domain-containing protein, partial [Eubacteriales bacterium]|nr:DUF4153 domain-containing protein [Eubacteriales bacterium]